MTCGEEHVYHGQVTVPWLAYLLLLLLLLQRLGLAVSPFETCRKPHGNHPLASVKNETITMTGRKRHKKGLQHVKAWIDIVGSAHLFEKP
jgi:hypothetical protein